MPANIICTPLAVSELPEIFHDLDPVPQDDSDAVACIDYKEDFRQAYDYMRAVWKADERSERALRLTVTCLQMNPANYTVWHFRRVCLMSSSINITHDDDDDNVQNNNNPSLMIADELQLATRLGGDNPKNYQIWYHRRAILEKLLLDHQNETSYYCYDKELEYIDFVLSRDSKNYHAWSYRQWLVQTLLNKTDATTVIPSEIAFVKSLILKDCRNNSAWNHYWFLTHVNNDTDSLSLEVAEEQAEYAFFHAQDDEFNESPWRFLVALVKEQVNKANNLAFLSTMLDKVQTMHSQDRYRLCNNVLSTLADLLELRGVKEDLEAALKLTKQLETQDVIRKKYWILRQDQLTAKLAIHAA